MGGAIDPPGKAAHDRNPFPGQPIGEIGSQLHVLGGSVARADDGNGCLILWQEVSSHVQHRRRAFAVAKVRGVGPILPRDDRNLRRLRPRHLLLSFDQLFAGKRQVRRIERGRRPIGRNMRRAHRLGEKAPIALFPAPLQVSRCLHRPRLPPHVEGDQHRLDASSFCLLIRLPHRVAPSWLPHGRPGEQGTVALRNRFVALRAAGALRAPAGRSLGAVARVAILPSRSLAHNLLT